MQQKDSHWDIFDTDKHGHHCASLLFLQFYSVSCCLFTKKKKKFRVSWRLCKWRAGAAAVFIYIPLDLASSASLAHAERGQVQCCPTVKCLHWRGTFDQPYAGLTSPAPCSPSIYSPHPHTHTLFFEVSNCAQENKNRTCSWGSRTY